MSDWTIKDDLEMLLLKEIEGGAFVYVPDMYSPERDNVKANMIKGCPESRIDDLYKKHYEPQLTEKDKKIQTLEAKIKDYESSHRGACFICEPVGELNKKLEALLIEACELISYFKFRPYGYLNNSGEFEVKGFEKNTENFLNKPFIKNLLNKEGVKSE